MIRGSRGFTLIELVVSLVVAGIVVAGAHQVVVLTAEVRARMAEVREMTVRSAGARDLLVTWLRGAVLTPEALPFRRTREGELDSEAVEFSVAHGGALFPGPRVVRLWIEKGPGRENGLMASVSRRAGEPGPAHVLVLEPAAERLTLRYWGSVDGSDKWVEHWPDREALPRIVELRLDATPRIRIGPGVADSWDLPPLLRLSLKVPVTMAGG